MQKTILYTLAGLSLFLLGAFSAWQSQDVTRDEVAAAAKVAGLSMTSAEIDSLLPAINEELLPAYAELYQAQIPNHTAPAWGFIPYPTGYTPPQGPDRVRIDLPWDTDLPADRHDLAYYSVRELAALLRKGKITSVELTQFFLERLRTYDPQLYCVISLTEERALQAAAQADAELQMGVDRGILHGIPYGAKDLLAVPGYRTSWGAAPYRDQKLDYTATVIEKLDAAGAVLVAKLSLGALAWGDVWYGGMTRNPWNTQTGSSGSSAGSASAVAAGLVPFALGTETLGSIVSPSTVCGTTGLRPTFGRVSRHGAMALSWTMDKIGPITRSAEDALAVLQIIDGPDCLDHTVQDIPLHYESGQKKKLRIGYDKSAFERERAQQAADQAVLTVLEAQGYELVPIELPAFPAINHILIVEAAAAFDELTRSNRDDELTRQVKNAWPNVFR
ncbi:MAG: amidase, partial [Bacteroidetes bacterium]